MPIGMIIVGAIILAPFIIHAREQVQKRTLEQTVRKCPFCDGGRVITEHHTNTVDAWSNSMRWHKQGCPNYYTR